VLCYISSCSSESSYRSQLTYLAKIHTDVDSGEVHFSDPRVDAVKHTVPDMPSSNQAVCGELSKQYVKNIKKEISALIEQNTCKTVPCSF